MCIKQGGEISPPHCSNVSVVILAGGQGKRVGFRQKALLPYKGETLLTHVLQRLTPLNLPIWLNVNVYSTEYNAYGLPQFSDDYQGFLGPMAGMHAAWNHVDSPWIIFMPCDNPSLPRALVEQLILAYQTRPAPLMAVTDGERIQPLYLLMHCSMLPALVRALEQSHLSVFRWIMEQPHTLVNFSKEKHAFQNVNTLDI